MMKTAFLAPLPKSTLGKKGPELGRARPENERFLSFIVFLPFIFRKSLLHTFWQC